MCAYIYASSSEGLRKKIEELKKENELLKKENEEVKKENELLKSRLKLYGWDASKETPFAKKSDAEKLAEIIRVFATCYTDDGEVDYSKAAKVFSTYESDELPRTEEECKKFDARLMKSLYHRLCDRYRPKRYFPTIEREEFKEIIYPALRLRFEKNSKKLILRDDDLNDDEVELHEILCKLYGLWGARNYVIISIGPAAIEFKRAKLDHKLSEELYQDWYMALSLESMKKFFEPEEVPEEFVKTGRYVCNYKLRIDT